MKQLTASVFWLETAVGARCYWLDAGERVAIIDPGMKAGLNRVARELREAGIPVIALKMAGTVPQHADLVVTDPIQAGVFAVMHVSSKAVFDISRVRGREF